MNKTIIKLKLLALSFVITTSAFTQQKLTKVSQSIKVDKDVTIDLNTSYTNIVFDTWNKSTVEIEAFIESDSMSKEESEQALKDWIVDVDATQKNISINTKSNATHINSFTYSYGDESIHKVMEELKHELADLQDMDFDFDFDFDFEMTEMPEIPEVPEIPELPELPEGMNNFQFDYEAYKKDGEKYLESYGEKFESKYGKEYIKKMEAWSENLAKQMELRAAQMEDQAKQSEEQHQQMAKMHEERAKMFEERAEAREKIAREREKLADERRLHKVKFVDKESNSKVKKTIIIKMPKDAKLKVNVRHGELKFASNIDNLKADLSYTKLTATSIDGSLTSINASYSPVTVSDWKYGQLNLNYVKNANLNNVKHIVLSSNTSNIDIQNLLGYAKINSSIGDLNILNIDDAFTNLDVNASNSDVVIALPSMDYNLKYKGDRSYFSHPNNTSKNQVSSFLNNNIKSDRTIVVNAKFSNVVMR